MSDPWFVRRHQFIGTISGKETAWAPTQLRSYASGGGSYLGGGLAQIAAIAGDVALVGKDTDGSVGTAARQSFMPCLVVIRPEPFAC